jgi:hypothetical protein
MAATSAQFGVNSHLTQISDEANDGTIPPNDATPATDLGQWLHEFNIRPQLRLVKAGDKNDGRFQ